MRKGFPGFHLMMVSVVVAGFVFLVAGCLAQQEHQPGSSHEDLLKRFLQDYVKDPSYDYKATRYRFSFVDLKDDGTRQVIVYFTDKYSCGTGGCTTLILTSEGSSYKVITSISIAHLPIRVLTTKSNGWHDISVVVAGGGIVDAYEAKLSFNGKKYPGNPTVPPAKRLVKKVPGKVVISDATGDTPLY